ncbi:MAG TPA: DUF5522 domain-containing protein [Cytophagaceae bacterium]|jgi:hypothetical protein|nr:DUF5522 domain-containing protein [Cytophagaceae bacterium]
MKNKCSVNLPFHQKKCSACGSDFSCGNTESDGGCWCNNFPAIFQLDSLIDCLCPVCLKDTAIKKINEYVESLSPEDALNNKAKDLPETKKQIEGIDFYIENGNYIFTAWYHLKRGDCCGNGCRHCPY